MGDQYIKTNLAKKNPSPTRQQRLFKGMLQVFTETWSTETDLSGFLCDENSIHFNTKPPQLHLKTAENGLFSVFFAVCSTETSAAGAQQAADCLQQLQ